MSRQIEYHDHALLRIHEHDILREEIEQALSAVSSKHKHRKDGRWEVRERVGKRRLLVVYVKNKVITVISAMWD